MATETERAEIKTLHAQTEIDAAALNAANAVVCGYFDSGETTGPRIDAARRVSIAAVDKLDVSRAAWRAAWVAAGKPLDICPNCDQWQRGPSRDCFNQCRKRGFIQPD